MVPSKVSSDGGGVERSVNRFWKGVYLSDSRFSYLPGFMRGVGQILDVANNKDELVEILRRNTDEALLNQRLATTEAARSILENRDLKRVCNAVEEDVSPESSYEPGSILQEIKSTCETGASILTANGLDVSGIPNVYMVDKLPYPYDRRSSTTALTVDREDLREYGIPEGIYFLRGAVKPLYSSFIALHEMIHLLFGRSDPRRIAHGFEEGISEVVGSLWLSCQILGPAVTRRLFVLNRLSGLYDPFWERYLDSARQALGVLLYEGMPGLLGALREGRRSIYNFERCGSCSLFHQRGRSSEVFDEFTGFAIDLLLRYPRAYVCSPEAFLFAERAGSYLTVAEISAKACLVLDLGRSAAIELRDQLGLVFLRRDGIVVLEADPAVILCKSWLRYATP